MQSNGCIFYSLLLLLACFFTFLQNTSPAFEVTAPTTINHKCYLELDEEVLSFLGFSIQRVEYPIRIFPFAHRIAKRKKVFRLPSSPYEMEILKGGKVVSYSHLRESNVWCQHNDKDEAFEAGGICPPDPILEKLDDVAIQYGSDPNARDGHCMVQWREDESEEEDSDTSGWGYLPRWLRTAPEIELRIRQVFHPNAQKGDEGKKRTRDSDLRTAVLSLSPTREFRERISMDSSANDVAGNTTVIGEVRARDLPGHL